MSERAWWLIYFLGFALVLEGLAFFAAIIRRVWRGAAPSVSEVQAIAHATAQRVTEETIQSRLRSTDFPQSRR
jgi:hypothetical protein